MLRQDFQCRFTQELCIARSIDDTHAVLTKLRRDFIRANTRTWCDCHIARDYNECGRGLIVGKTRRISPTTPMSDSAAQLFYNRLFDVDPSVRALFKGDMNEQNAKLIHMIGVAVADLSSPESIASTVAKLRRRHVEYGVGEGHYTTVRETLL